MQHTFYVKETKVFKVTVNLDADRFRAQDTPETAREYVKEWIKEGSRVTGKGPRRRFVPKEVVEVSEPVGALSFIEDAEKIDKAGGVRNG